MKSLKVFALLLSIMLLLSGCSYVAYKDYFSSADSYDDIWQLSGFSQEYCESTPLFPNNINELNVNDLFCRYDQQILLGEGFQILLEVQYDDNNLYNSELSRISELAFECNEYFDNEKYNAFATQLDANLYYEYVLIDRKESKLYYIYLQNIPKEEIEINNEFLPVELK